MKILREANYQIKPYKKYSEEGRILLSMPRGEIAQIFIGRENKFGYTQIEYLREYVENIDECGFCGPVELKGTTYYLYQYKKKFYYSEIEMSKSDVEMVVNSEIVKKKDGLKAEIERIRAKEELEGKKRIPIPKNVQMTVWNRDKGKCVVCESKDNLEFDHIIPGSKGGSNTARNIQLLCEKCNREKGAKIGA